MNIDHPSIEFVNHNSEELYGLREHVLLGISPFNSYYNEENLKKLFNWGLANFKSINVCIPDEASMYTLQAIGYSEDKARRKTKRHDNNLKNKAIKALIASNLSKDEAESKIVLFSDLIHNKKYIERYNTYQNLYESDVEFKNGCLMTSKLVLAVGKNESVEVSDEALQISVKYLLAEFPLYMNTPEILNISSSLFVYKDLPADFVWKIYNDNCPFGSLVSKQQGYLAVNFDK